MDRKLLSWARAVKARRGRHATTIIPPLWLFTDQIRLPDPLAAVARLPRGLGGVVFRDDARPDRAELGRRLARLCRQRRLILVVAGDSRLAAELRAGVHLRAGRWPDLVRRGTIVTSSAHDARELRRARLAGADACFLSPIFPTASHPEGRSLGVMRWTHLARQASRGGLAVLALGGVAGDNAARLPRRVCAGAAAIGALA